MAQTATVQIQMPEMGESVTEGIVLEWHVAVGDFVNEGDTVVEVSTDKVDAEVPAPEAGVITKLLVQVDDEVPVGAPLAKWSRATIASPGSTAGSRGSCGTDGRCRQRTPTALSRSGDEQQRVKLLRSGVRPGTEVDLGGMRRENEPRAKVVEGDVLH